jgi:nucleotide-binding universal stress UspA family protein
MEALHPRIIVVALDTSPRAAGVLATAAEFAQKMGGRLVLVHAVGMPMEIPAEALVEPPSRLPAILEGKARVDLDAQASALPAGLVAKTIVTPGTAWDTICRVAEEEHAELIVLGSHGFSGLDRLLGTTASRVVNHANRSVLVVREPGPAHVGHPHGLPPS